MSHKKKHHLSPANKDKQPKTLYRPYCEPEGFLGRQIARVDWLCLNRQSPVAPYAELITNYEDLNEDTRYDAEKFIDELFADEEIARLSPIEDVFYGYPLKFEQMELPVDTNKPGSKGILAHGP